MFGYTREELIGQKIEILVPERQRATAPPPSRASITRNRKFAAWDRGLTFTARSRDGSEFPVEISLSPVTVGRWRDRAERDPRHQ